MAESWLYRQGCGIVLRERSSAHTSEAPDAIGFRTDASVLVECKLTRSDYLADKKKPFRINPTLGMGDYRFYLTPAGLMTLRSKLTR